MTHLLSPAMQTEIEKESILVDSISEIAQKVKINKNRVKNIFILKNNLILKFFKESLIKDLQVFAKNWPQTSSRLPFDISAAINAVDVEVG